MVTPRGEYISPSFNISNDLNRALTELRLQYTNSHNQTLEVFISTSSNNENWSSWKSVKDGDYGILNDVNSHDLFLRYKIFFSSQNRQNRPYLQKITFLITPATLLVNTGDLPLKPKIWIKKKNSQGEIRVKNMMTGQILSIDNMSRNEQLFIDNENEELISSNQSLGVYRYDNHNDEWLELLPGENYIQGFGDFDLDVRMQGKLLAD